MGKKSGFVDDGENLDGLPDVDVELPSNGGDLGIFRVFMETLAVSNLTNKDFNSVLWKSLMAAHYKEYGGDVAPSRNKGEVEELSFDEVVKRLNHVKK